MKSWKFSEAQIVPILNAVEMGAKVGQTGKADGTSEPTLSQWEGRFSVMTASQLRQFQD